VFEQSKVFPNLVGLSALLIAGSAAFFSVFGLSKLFAGASLSVIIMAGSLEFGKLVAASFLYRYWKKINFLHKTYMTIAVITLVLITSAGIFGFLSNAYQGATVQFEKESTTLLFKEERLKQLQEDKVFLKEELDAGIADLPDNFRTARRKLREDYQPLILEVNQKMLDVKGEIGDLKTALVETGVDVGPAIYIARTFGTDIDTVVKFFIFILIFVFDPMAVIFVLSYNVILQDRYETSKNGRSEKRKNGKKWWEVYGEKEKKKIQENFNQAVKNDKRFDKSEELIEKVEEPEDIKEEERVKLFRGAFSRKKSEKR
tara:strand:- start:402 stop:1349 length:948 start_codon:yes stop_codon:yes gene_type:complete